MPAVIVEEEENSRNRETRCAGASGNFWFDPRSPCRPHCCTSSGRSSLLRRLVPIPAVPATKLRVAVIVAMLEVMAPKLRVIEE
jgi:hypothetical protein